MDQVEWLFIMDDMSSEQLQKEFGLRVRELRQALGISQEDLALACQLDRSYLGQVERGERNISLINIHKIARGLGIQADELMMPRGSPNSIKGTA